MSYEPHPHDDFQFGPPPEWPRQQKTKLWLAVGGGVIALGLGIAVFVVAYQQRNRPLPAREKETKEEKYAETSAAFSGELDSDDEELVAVNKLFAKYGRGIKDRSVTVVADCFNTDRMYREMERIGAFEGLSSSEEQGVREGIKTALPSKTIQNAVVSGFDDFKITHLRFIGDKNEVVAYVRFWDEAGFSSKMRWWLIKTDRGWQFYDYEELETSLRVSDVMAMSLGTFGRDTAAASTAVGTLRKIQTVSEAFISGDTDTAETALESITTADLRPLPKALKAVYWMQWSALHCLVERYDEALETVEKARQLHEDMPVLHYQRAIAYNGLARHADAEKSAREYLSLLGDEAMALEELGIAMEAQGRLDEAADAFRKGAEDDPNYYMNLVHVARLLPADNKSELASLFGKVRRPGEWFELICEEFIYADDYESLEVVTAAYARIDPSDPDVAYYDAHVKFAREQYEEGARVVFPAIGQTAEDDREFFVDLYLDCMIAAGKASEAYKNAPDAVYAFDYLGYELLYSDDDSLNELEALIAAHQTATPKSQLLDFFKGELAGSREQWDDAIAAYRAGMENADDRETVSQCRESLVHVMYLADRVVKAYETVEPKDDVFAQLVGLMTQGTSGDNTDRAALADQAASLAEARKKTAPTDGRADFLDAEVFWIREDYAAVVKTLEERRTRILASDISKWKFDDRLIRSLIKLKRFPEALKATEQADSEYDEDMFFRALIYAVQGDVAKTISWLEKYTEDDPYLIEAIYEDPMLGPLLRSDELTAVRQRFPLEETETTENLP